MIRAVVNFEDHYLQTLNLIKERVKEILEETANWVVDNVASETGEYYAPIISGDLRDSITAQESEENELEWLVGNNPEQAPYGIYVEMGTARWPLSMGSRTGHRPFLKPAAEASGKYLLELLREEGFE